jgi:hypothetical protein
VARPISGISTQGATALGQASTEIGPSSVIMRGERANATPAIRRVHGEPMFSFSASRTTPVHATVMTRAHQRRWTTQAGMPTSLPARKNEPIGHR